MSIFPSVVKKYINSFLCPMCHCGLDGTPWSNIDGYNQLVLYCAYNRNHFFKELGWYSTFPTDVRHIRDVLIFYAEGMRYTIEKRYGVIQNIIYSTRIYFLPVDDEGRWPEGLPGKEIRVDGDAINFNSFKLEECLDRINTIIMFQ
jgi:hypothetical protein